MCLDRESQQAIGSLSLLTGGFLALGGATLLIVPRLVATVDAMRHLRTEFAFARAAIGPWGVALAGTAGVVWAFAQTTKEAGQSARDFAEDLRDSGATAAEQAASLRADIAELQDQLDRWDTERFSQGLRASETPARELKAEIAELEVELAKAESGFFDLSGELVTGTGPALASVADGASLVTDAMRETDPELAAAIDEFEAMSGAAEDTASAFDGMTDAQRRAAAAIAPAPYYPMEVAS